MSRASALFDVAVTGVGLVTSLGAGREETWRAALAGQGGIHALPAGLFPGAQEFAGALPPLAFPPTAERTIHYALRAAREAVEDAGLTREPGLLAGTACVLGCSKGGLITYERCAPMAPDVPADFIFNALPAMPSARVAEALGLGGPVMSEAAACATGAVCIARAASLIRRGERPAAVAGASDASLTPLLLGSYRNADALACASPPEGACRPFDRRRSGFLVGEGAAVLVLERLDLARRRGAAVYGLLAAGVMGSEAFHAMRPHPTGEPLERVARLALQRAGLAPEQAGFIHAHAAGTRLGDAAEAAALLRVFGSSVPVVSTKAHTGHLLGAASAAGAAFLFLALRDKMLPATRNLERPGKDDKLNHVIASPRAVSGPGVLTAAGFGGHLAVLVAIPEEPPCR